MFWSTFICSLSLSQQASKQASKQQAIPGHPPLFVGLVLVHRQDGLWDARHHVQLLQHGVHVAGGPCILQTHVATRRSPVHWRHVLGKKDGRHYSYNNNNNNNSNDYISVLREKYGRHNNNNCIFRAFFNTCLRRIYKIQCQEIRNQDLGERAGQKPVAMQILRRKWGWIGHTLRKPVSSTIHKALTWNPQGKRKRGWSPNSLRRGTEADLKQQGTNWSGMTIAAQNRVR